MNLDSLTRDELLAELRSSRAALARLKDEQTRTRIRLEKLDQVSQVLGNVLTQAQDVPAEQLMDVIVSEARRIVDAEFAALGIGTDPTRPFQVWAFSGLDPALASILGRHPGPVGLLGEVQRTGQATRIRDLRSHPAFGGYPAHHPEMRSFLGIPISFRGNSIGTLCLTNKRSADEFSEDDQYLAEWFAERKCVPELLDELVLLTESIAAVRAIRVGLDASSSLPAIWCDRSRVLQVLLNLVGSSIKFAAEGSVISVHASAGTAGVTFVVSDRGFGIAEDQLPHLFDRYWKGSPSGQQAWAWACSSPE